MHRAETALCVTRDLGFGAGVAGEPDEAKVSRPVRRGAVGKGASSWTGHLVSRLPNNTERQGLRACFPLGKQLFSIHLSPRVRLE